MSDYYTKQLLERYHTGRILASEKETLYAMLKPCIEKDTASELERDIFSKLVIYLLQLPALKPFQPSNLNVETRRKQPLRDCNKPYPLYYLLKDEKNSYNLVTSVHNESKQPETINMQFTLTNFNDFKPTRLASNSSDKAIHVFDSCNHAKGCTFYDGKSLWIAIFNTEVRKELRRAARTLKITTANSDVQKQVISLVNNSNHGEKFSKLSVYNLDDMVTIVNHILKNLPVSRQL